MKGTKKNSLAFVSFLPLGAHRYGGLDENDDTCDWIINKGDRLASALSSARPSMATGLTKLL